MPYENGQPDHRKGVCCLKVGELRYGIAYFDHDLQGSIKDIDGPLGQVGLRVCIKVADTNIEKREQDSCINCVWPLISKNTTLCLCLTYI